MSKTENWWARQDLNLGPTDYESAALTAELQARSGECSTEFNIGTGRRRLFGYD